jgi:hypothetical protein
MPASCRRYLDLPIFRRRPRLSPTEVSRRALTVALFVVVVVAIPRSAQCRDAGAAVERVGASRLGVAQANKDDAPASPRPHADGATPDAGSGGQSAGATPPNPSAGPSDPTTIIFLYALIVGLFIFALMGWDLKNAYKAATDIRARLFANLKDPTPDQLRALATDLSQALPGIPGLARSTLALGLLLILGIVLFHLLVFGAPGFNNGEVGKLVHDLAILLGGSLTSITAFYFGGRAVQEGAASAASQPKAPPSAGASIAKLTPDHGAVGAGVTISGAGFGPKAGQVKFGDVDAAVATWSDTAIQTKVPSGLVQGPIAVTVNPVGTAAVASSFTVTA